MKTISIKQVLNSVPKRVAAIFGVTAAVLVPMVIFAWGPERQTYTIEKPADHITFNSITNNPNYGDERNFLRVRDADKNNWTSNQTNGWSDVAVMQEGHTYDVKLYVHNNAAANLNLEAQNVRAHINLPIKDNTWGKQFEINGYLWADNAKPNEIWDNIVLKSDKEFHVKVVSQKYYNNVKTEVKGGFDLGNEVYTAKGAGTGALLGYNEMNGRIKGCYEYSGYVLLKVQPVFKTAPKPGYDVIKTVDKKTAKPGDTITYTITAKNTGNTDLTNAKITDKLPNYYASANEKVNAPSDITGSIIKNGQVTIASLPVGKSATITITYQIKNDLECGKTIIKNKATGTTDQDQTEDDNNNNEVITEVTKDCPVDEKKPGYDVIKTVDKKTAKPGETISYTITAKNTGEVDLTNVKITDKLPTYYAKASEKITAPSKFTGSIVKGGEVTISKLGVGQTATIKVTYQIKNDLECGKTIIKNKATGVTDQDKTEDNDNNNEVTTEVTKDCPVDEKKPGYDISKTVDKTTAKPGDTLYYVINVKNTGEVNLTNVVVTDVLPKFYSKVTSEVTAKNKFTNDLLKDGKVTFTKLEVGETATIKISYQLKDNASFECGITTVKNKVTGTTDQDQTEDNDNNNEVTTEINKECKPVVPPETPQTPTPQQPTIIAQTGAGETIATVIGLGAIAVAITAYIRSRQLVKK